MDFAGLETAWVRVGAIMRLAAHRHVDIRVKAVLQNNTVGIVQLNTQMDAREFRMILFSEIYERVL
jgi:hypothetical protein